MAEGRFFYAGPQALDEPTAGRCYNETTQDGKRKMSPPGNRVSAPAGDTWPGLPQIRLHGCHRWPWHLKRSRLIVPCVPRSWSRVFCGEMGRKTQSERRSFFRPGRRRTAGADGKTAACSRRLLAADGRPERRAVMARKGKFCGRIEGTAATGFRPVGGRFYSRSNKIVISFNPFVKLVLGTLLVE